MNKLSFFLIIFLTAFVFIKTAEAKVLPQSAKAVTKQTSVKSTSTNIGVYPRLRADRRALIVNFSNLQNAKSVSYMLIYTQTGQEEAAMGALNLIGQSNATVELLFGTCSKNVCRYHQNISNARLEVSYTSKSGKKYLKKFKIRV